MAGDHTGHEQQQGILVERVESGGCFGQEPADTEQATAGVAPPLLVVDVFCSGVSGGQIDVPKTAGIAMARHGSATPHSAARSAQSPEGNGSENSCSFSVTSPGVRAPVSTVVTAGCRNGNCSAAALSGTSW